MMRTLRMKLLLGVLLSIGPVASMVLGSRLRHLQQSSSSSSSSSPASSSSASRLTLTSADSASSQEQKARQENKSLTIKPPQSKIIVNNNGGGRVRSLTSSSTTTRTPLAGNGRVGVYPSVERNPMIRPCMYRCLAGCSMWENFQLRHCTRSCLAVGLDHFTDVDVEHCFDFAKQETRIFL